MTTSVLSLLAVAGFLVGWGNYPAAQVFALLAIAVAIYGLKP